MSTVNYLDTRLLGVNAYKRTEPHRTEPHRTEQNSKAQHRTGHHRIAQDITEQNRTEQQSTTQDSTAQHNTGHDRTAQNRTEQHRTAQHNTTQDRTGQKSGTWKVWNCPHPPKREKQITKQRNKRNMSYFWFLLIHSLSSLFVYVMIWTLLFYIHSASRTQSIEIINNKIIKIYNNQWGPRWSCDCLGVWLMYYFMKYTLYDDNNLFGR